MKMGNGAARAALLLGFTANGALAQALETAEPPNASASNVSASDKAAPNEDGSKAFPDESEEGVVPTAPEGNEDQDAAPPTSDATIPKVVCGLETFEGMAESDARAAAAMICQDLRKYGELVEDHDGELPPAAEGYRVRTYQLGQRLLLDVSYEKPVGSVKSSVRVEIESAEDLVEESERLVAALKEGKPIERAEPKAEPGPPPAEKEPGILMYAGIIGFTTLGDLQGSAGGADLGLSVPVNNFSFTPHGRLAFGEATVAGLGIDLRYYLTGGANAMFIGAGMGAVGLTVGEDGTRASGGGPVGSMLLGVEFNRTARSRVGFNLRADFPAFSLDINDFDSETSDSVYLVPLGANLYLTL